jgi:hypothetical protein
MQHARRVGLLLAAAALIVAGCGEAKPWSQTYGSGRAGAARTKLLAAVDSLTAAKTARVAMSMRLDGPGLFDVTADGAGVIDFENGAARLTLDMRAGGERTEVEVRAIDGTVYVNAGGGWISQRTADALVSGGTSDPEDYVAWLRGIADDVRVAGSEEVRGTPTTRYVATISLARAAEHAALDGDDRAAAQAALGVLGDVRMPATVWIDDDDRLRKFRIEVDIADAMKKASGGLVGGDVTANMEITMELYDFGVDVDVRPPVDVATAGAQRPTPVPAE